MDLEKILIMYTIIGIYYATKSTNLVWIFEIWLVVILLYIIFEERLDKIIESKIPIDFI